MAVVIVEHCNVAALLCLVVVREGVFERALCVASTLAGSRPDPRSLPDPERDGSASAIVDMRTQPGVGVSVTEPVRWVRIVL